MYVGDDLMSRTRHVVGCPKDNLVDVVNMVASKHEDLTSDNRTRRRASEHATAKRTWGDSDMIIMTQSTRHDRIDI